MSNPNNNPGSNNNNNAPNNQNSNNNNSNSSSKGWFEGTMEVISGMDVISGLAPRPSTPVSGMNQQGKKKRPGNQNNNARGSMSAPSSPARSATSAFFPLINRLPSQDSMDRSIHNESTSSHGNQKSASQIIRELKQSNAALSAKTATMEADFMNQLNHQNRKAEERQRRLEETIKKSEKLLGALEGRCNNAEQSLREREEQLTKLREEGAFQRHTISDLKNQMHQMELEQEHDAYGKRDDTDKWKAEKIRMEHEMEDLRAQVQDSQVLQQEVERLNHKLDDMKASAHMNNLVIGNSGGDDDSVHSQLGSSQRSSYTNRSFMKQNLPQTREVLKKTKHKLSVTEAALDILKQERARMMDEHQMELDGFHQHLEATEQAHQEREAAMKTKIHELEQQGGLGISSSPSNDESFSSLDGGKNSEAAKQQETIHELQEQLRLANSRVNELTTKLDKVRSDFENQEQYRADEAEDLRVLHDAQEEEIERLRKSLDDVNRELELRDQELEEQKMTSAAADKEQEKSNDDDDDNVDEEQASDSECTGPVEAKTQPESNGDAQAVANLKERLQSSEAAIERLETSLDTTQKEHHDRVEHLETVLHEVTEEKEYAEEQLAQLSAVLVVNQRAPVSSSSLGPGDEMSEMPADGSTAADLSTMLRNIEKLQESEKNAVARAKELEYVQAELDELRNSRQSETQELEELVVRLKESEAKLASTRDGAMEEYRAEIQKLREKLKTNKESQRVNKLDEQLRESKARITEIENEKAEMAEEYMERIGRLELDKEGVEEELQKLKEEKSTMSESQTDSLNQFEKDKTRLEEDFESQIKARDSEIAQLKETMDQLWTEKDQVLKQLQISEEEKEKLMNEHEQSLEKFNGEMKNMEKEFMQQLQEKESEISELLVNTSSASSAGEPTSDSDQIAVLKQEVEKLQKQLLEEQVVQQRERSASNEFIDPNGYQQSGGAMESDLRKQLESVKREKDQESRTLKEKLEDRDTTISALVKSSVVLEQKISDLSGELYKFRQGQDASAAAQSSKSLSADRSMEEAQEEISELRDALSDYKEVETRLIHELSLAKKQLKFAETEISRLQEVMDDDNSVESHHYRRQIQERDDAVSSLVQQSMSHETAMQELQKRLHYTTQELEAMREEKRRSSVQLKAELRRLHQESEIFAGQIIEQDEELEALRAEIHNRDENIQVLNRQLTAARGPNYRPGMMTPNGESPEVVSLSAQIDELEEANATYRTEMRDLRFKLRDFDSIRDELDRVKYELEEYENMGDLQAEVAAREKAERKLEELQASKENNVHSREQLARERDALVGQRDKVIEDLRRNIDGCTSQIEALETEIDTVHGELKEKTQQLEMAELKVAKLEAKENSSSRSIGGEANGENPNESSALFEEVEDLQQQVKDLEAENEKLAAFKEKMTEVEELHSRSRTMAEAYERKISLLASDKDGTIDMLQKSLMEIKVQADEDFSAMTRDMKKLDLENQTLRQEMERVLQEKNNQLFAMEHALDAQAQLVGKMKSEMDHLQGSMVNTVSSRREEIEEREREVVDLTTQNASFEREITMLKMELEESKLLHRSEVLKLRETVDRLERNQPSSPVPKERSPIEDFPIHEVQERLQKLRWRNNSIQEENFKLKSRLEKAEAEIQTARNEKYRTANLEAKVGALTQQLEKVERENQMAIHRARSAAAKEGGGLPPVARMTPPQSPQRSRAPSPSGSRSAGTRTPLRSSSLKQQRQQESLVSQSTPGSRQGTPSRSRSPLRTWSNSQKHQSAPNTPNRKKGIFGFGRKKDRENTIAAPQPKTQSYLVPPSNPSAPNSERVMKAPISSKSIQSAS